MRAGPVDLRAIAGKDLLPCGWLIPCDRAPVIDLDRIGKHLFHVMARPEAEQIERILERTRARAAETRADDRQCHDGVPPVLPGA